MKSFIHLILAWFAYWRFGRPSRKLIVIGVTGTKGKSTTSRLIASVLEAGGFKVGLLSTVEFQVGDKRWLNDKKMTMLGRGQIQSMLRDMVAAGCQYAVVETSSEGILQYRHYGLNYDVAVFTNLGNEHSERHGGFEKLRSDKGKLFTALNHARKNIFGKNIPTVSVVNADDENASFYVNYPADQQWVFSLKNARVNKSAQRVDGTISSSSVANTSFVANGKLYQLNIVGGFNVPNALAAIAVGASQGVGTEAIAKGLQSVAQVAGRMEFVEAGQAFKALVDYAHEPMSLTALFVTLRGLIGPTNKVIALVGSDGGGRDIKKRSTMGEIAGRLTDYVVVSDVNCFDEDPGQIAEMLAAGARQGGKKDGVDLFIEVDRRNGVKKVIALARPGDVVVLTAKGTEPCIVVANGKKIPWSDARVLREELEALKK